MTTQLATLRIADRGSGVSRLRATGLVAGLAVIALLLAGAPASAHSVYSDGRNEPVVLVHGVDILGEPGSNCYDQVGQMRDALRNWGWATVHMLGYYENDVGCSAMINNDGSHSVHYGSGHYADGGHGANTDIRHLGYHLAWDIYNRYTSKYVEIDMFGHSMGGLIIRYALAQVARQHHDFPPSLWVEDVVTGGTPHGGARTGSWVCPYTQCDQMDMGSSFLNWLEDYGWAADGGHFGGTDWSTFGSDDDDYVAADRAAGTSRDRSQELYVGSCHKLWYLTAANVEHSDFVDDVSTVIDDDVYKTPTTMCAGGWTFDTTYYHPVRAADQAMMYETR